MKRTISIAAAAVLISTVVFTPHLNARERDTTTASRRDTQQIVRLIRVVKIFVGRITGHEDATPPKPGPTTP